MLYHILGRFGFNRNNKKRKTQQRPTFRGHRSLHLEPLEDRRMLATLTVNVNDDFASNIDNGALTLREAIAVVNGTYDPQQIGGDLAQIDETVDTLGQNDIIQFAPAITGDNEKITLTEGQLAITNDLTILGPGKGQGDPAVYDLVLSGNEFSRIFDIVGTSVEISGLKLTNGSENEGGAIRAVGSDIVIADIEISGNHASSGGGMYASMGDKSLTISSSVFENNIADIDGGALWLSYSVDASGSISQSHFENNEAGGAFGFGSGGALFINRGPLGDLLIDDVVVTHNQAVTSGGEVSGSEKLREATEQSLGEPVQETVDYNRFVVFGMLVALVKNQYLHRATRRALLVTR